MKKLFYVIGLLPIILFIWISKNYETASFVRFDEKMFDKLYGTEWIIKFHYIGDTIFVMIVTLIVILYFGLKEKNYRAVLFTLLTVVGGTLVNQGLKSYYARPRPDIADQLDSFSFPSGHSMLSALYLLTLAYLLGKLIKNSSVKVLYFAIAIVLFVMIGMSRVAEARHFATDVLAGWSLGIVWFTLCVIWYELRERKTKKHHSL